MKLSAGWDRGRKPASGSFALPSIGLPAVAASLILFAAPAWALSEIGREELPPPQGMTPGTVPDPRSTAPTFGTGGSEDEAQPENDGSGDGTDAARPQVDPDEPLPEILYNLDRLPEPVRRMHERLVAAAKSGELESLRPLLGTGEDETQLSFGGVEGDPIQFLKSLSGDGQGQEILAILEEVLNAGFVHLDAGAPSELYVWPYFFAMPLDKLDNRQRVELFKIVTAGDYEDMKAYGTYVFYRVGIDPEGRFMFFVAGD